MSRVGGKRDRAPAAPPVAPLWTADAPGYVIGIVWSPDGTQVAIAAGDGPIDVLDAATGVPHYQLGGHAQGTATVTWSPDGQTIATAGQDGMIRLWDPATGRERRELEGGASWVDQLAWSPDGDLLASASGKLLRLWTGAGDLARSYAAAPSTVATIAWRPRSRVLASGGYGGITLWKIGRASC